MFNLLFLCVVQTQIKAIMNTQSPTERVCSQGSIYWSPNDACGQVLGKEHSGRVRGVGLGPTPGKSTSYNSGQRSVSSAPTPREAAMAIEMESLKSLYESQNVKFQEQSAKLQEQNANLKSNLRNSGSKTRSIKRKSKRWQPSNVWYK
jgi:hypothetical protein